MLLRREETQPWRAEWEEEVFMLVAVASAFHMCPSLQSNLK